MRIIICLAAAILLSSLAYASGQCGGTAILPVSRVELPGSPFKIAVTADGCTLFVSLTGQGTRKAAGIAVLRRREGRLELLRTMKTSKRIWGLALTHDGKTLIAADGKGAMLLDAVRLKSGKGNPHIGSVGNLKGALTIYANITQDGQTLFISNEKKHSISVVDLPSRKVLGRIEVGTLPIALTFSPDERLLYTTSQTATPDWGWPNVCDSELPKDRIHKHPHGAIVVIDVALARTDPARAVVARVDAGCNPVRLALSPAADVAYVTARKDNNLLVFDPSKLISDPANSKIASVAVGVAPVPVVALPGGRSVLVGNSNRFGTGSGDPNLNLVDTAKYTVSGKIPSGEFPRDLVLSPDGRTLYIASFGSCALEMLDVERLPFDRLQP